MYAFPILKRLFERIKIKIHYGFIQFYYQFLI